MVLIENIAGGITIRQSIIVLSVGLGVMIAAYLSMVYQIYKNKRINISQREYMQFVQKNSIAQAIVYRITKIVIWIKGQDRKALFAIVVISILIVTNISNIANMPANIFLIIGIGLIALYLFEKVRNSAVRAKKLKEVSVLFEAIELYSRAGFSLVQSLKAAKHLTNTIHPAIDKCLARWSVNPQRAIEGLKNDLDIEESESLILMILHLETEGSKGLQGALKREARNIERKQRMQTEIKISHRPLILTIYKIFPMFSVLGIVLGSLLFRIFISFLDIGLIDIAF